MSAAGKSDLGPDIVLLDASNGLPRSEAAKLSKRSSPIGWVNWAVLLEMETYWIYLGWIFRVGGHPSDRTPGETAQIALYDYNPEKKPYRGPVSGHTSCLTLQNEFKKFECHRRHPGTQKSRSQTSRKARGGRSSVSGRFNPASLISRLLFFVRLAYLPRVLHLQPACSSEQFSVSVRWFFFVFRKRKLFSFLAVCCTAFVVQTK